MRSLCTWILALTLAPAVMLAQAQSFVSAGDNNRLALVIGNSSYRDAPLTNPVNDANAMARSLEAVGFKVILLTNATRNSMRQGMRQFTDQIQAGRGVALFYYAGHGIQINGRNYLLPVGSDVQREYEVEDEAIDAGSVLNLMSAAKSRVNIVILDACRNNPFTRSFRSAINGLAPMQAPAGTVLAYATAPGEVASDGSGDNGLYTQHLLKNLSIPGLRIEDVFKNVRVGVRQDSGGKQIPWENTSLEGDFYFKAGTATPGAQASGLTAEQVQQVVTSALAGRDQEESARRQAQQLEIERAVQAALQKREQEAAAAQASNQTQQVQAAQAAVAKLKQELAELRVANQAPQPSPPALPTEDSEQQPETAGPQRLALAAPTSRPAPRFTVGQPVARPDVAVGDRWRYQVTDLYTDLKHLVDVEVQSVTASRIYTHSSVTNTEIGIASGSATKKIQVWDRDWNLLRDGVTENSAPQPGFQFPLNTGKRWESTNKLLRDEATWREEYSGHITGWEKITVPSGTFDAVRVELKGYAFFDHPSYMASASGPTTEIIYYSPAAGRVIKREIEKGMHSDSKVITDAVRERWELVEFSR